MVNFELFVNSIDNHVTVCYNLIITKEAII